MLTYNAARCAEAAGDAQCAQRGYRSILKDNPAHQDSLLRLAYIAHHRGEHAQSIHWAKTAEALDSPSPDALAVLGASHCWILHSCLCSDSAG